jgi:4-amino-4-deoxy-L-arabinose transferase-like glycosyltransferase
MSQVNRSRPRSTTIAMLVAWVALYASFTLWAPALLDDADSVHAEVAREMLLRHDYVTLYANGIRYLEKAPLLYWSMAASMKLAALCGATSVHAAVMAVRFPLALAVLALAWLVELFARRLYDSRRAGLYAALIVLSSAGVFLFTRITLPDVGVCLWLTLALGAWFFTEDEAKPSPRNAMVFGLACALGVLSKGLIGLVFPIAIVVTHALLTRGVKRGLLRLRTLFFGPALWTFLAVAAPWHVLAGLANPGVGHPEAFRFVDGNWHIPLPTDGNVRGWFWFYFMNEHVLRYLNLRVPRDYDTSPLWLFWGLCLVWIMPWSAFVFKAYAGALRWRDEVWRSQWRRHDLPWRERGQVLLVVWTAFVLLFFSLSTRQEYYVLPALPAVAIVIAGWLARERRLVDDGAATPMALAAYRSGLRCTLVLVVLGAVFAICAAVLLLVAKTPPPGTDLADLLRQNPGDYALSMGHFLDLDTRAMGMFRLPLALAALSLFGGPLVAFLLRRRKQTHLANWSLAIGAFGFLIAAHLGLQCFAPVLGSAQLAQAIAPQVHPQDMVAIHGEYESGSTLGFYLRRNNVHIVDGRSSNLWYGSFFPDAPKIFETDATLLAKWNGPQRIFLWQSMSDPPNTLPPGLSPVYVLARSGGKEIVSNQPNGK